MNETQHFSTTINSLPLLLSQQHFHSPIHRYEFSNVGSRNNSPYMAGWHLAHVDPAKRNQM